MKPENDFARSCTSKGVGHEDKFRIIKKDTKKVKLGKVWRKHGTLGYRCEQGRGSEI